MRCKIVKNANIAATNVRNNTRMSLFMGFNALESTLDKF